MHLIASDTVTSSEDGLRPGVWTHAYRGRDELTLCGRVVRSLHWAEFAASASFEVSVPWAVQCERCRDEVEIRQRSSAT